MRDLPDKATHAWRDLEGEVIFLDISGDRYFRLPDERNAAVLAGAHCWAQSGPVVLNDTWDEVQRFAPLLVL
ncbi:hypothetical protein ACLBKU_07630 [Erythrobacter sp. NE805]|uniref:hypothetical protein n=1 Tax=Erythrobacter sp. NE805 TaxID=3389875 RepID=UPI00396B17A4